MTIQLKNYTCFVIIIWHGRKFHSFNDKFCVLHSNIVKVQRNHGNEILLNLRM
jgi:hypothetical protein